ncbi:MAG: hypothetical protein HYY96_18265 [Candidatus Tectomicrobia bacterium]|nr:hypothetical protein [Candidatus Tectomicrobia bacterium]
MAQVDSERVREEIISILDTYTAAVCKVTEAYAGRRTKERDINWLALQAAKEYGAARVHAGIMLDKAKAMAALEDIEKSHGDAFEEVEHYHGYMKVLAWLLQGEPIPVPDFWGYGDFQAPTFLPGPGLRRERWPWNHAFFSTGMDYLLHASSPWIRRAMITSIEGAAVGFHYAMSRLPRSDGLLERIHVLEQSVVDDELHHGPEVIDEIAAEPPREAVFNEALEKIWHLRELELYQRNEQFLQPMTEDEVRDLARAMRAKAIAPVDLYRSALRS